MVHEDPAAAGALDASTAGERDGDGARYTVPEGVGWVQDDGRVIVARLGVDERVALSSTAAMIFHLAATGDGTADIVDTLRVDFVDAPPELAEQVAATLGTLESAGFLSRISQ